MPISEAALKALPLGKDVYDDLTYCMQEWQEAGYKAVTALPPPDDSDATLDWFISLVGNMAWAATVFFPPAFEAVAAAKLAQKGIAIAADKLIVASASAATKATSMLGAGLAAGIVPQLRKIGKLNSPQGKEFLNGYLSTQVPDTLKSYASEADQWVQKELVNRMLSASDPRNNNDAAFTTFYNSVAGAEARRRVVWNEFVFPDSRTPYDNKRGSDGSVQAGGQAGLQQFIASGLKDALDDFDRQWDKYQDDIERFMLSKATRAVASLRGNYMFQHPFNPTLKYKGVPPALQELQNSNRRKLKTMMRSS